MSFAPCFLGASSGIRTMTGYLATQRTAILISSPDELTVLRIDIGINSFDGFHLVGWFGC